MTDLRVIGYDDRKQVEFIQDHSVEPYSSASTMLVSYTLVGKSI
jgi:hypothetical protein